MLFLMAYRLIKVGIWKLWFKGSYPYFLEQFHKKFLHSKKELPLLRATLGLVNIRSQKNQDP